MSSDVFIKSNITTQVDLCSKVEVNVSTFDNNISNIEGGVVCNCNEHRTLPRLTTDQICHKELFNMK